MLLHFVPVEALSADKLLPTNAAAPLLLVLCFSLWYGRASQKPAAIVALHFVPVEAMSVDKLLPTDTTDP